MKYNFFISMLVILLVGACAGPTDEDSAEEVEDGKVDSGWLSNRSFEVDAVVRGMVEVEASLDWEDIATDPALQMHLIDLQVKYAKNETESRGYRINQLVDSVDSVEVSVNGTTVTLTYEATVDMVKETYQEVPTLEDLEDRVFAARLPMSPIGVYYQANVSCANDPDKASSYNYHYYFDPDQPECDIELSEAEIEIVEVFERTVVYPEYDQLMQPRDDGTVGFDAAIVPARGDDEPLGRFDAHKHMLENSLDLEGVVSEDGTYTTYEWVKGNVKVVIALHDPTQDYFASTFQRALRDYDLVYYNGHSAYGTQQLLTNPDAFSDGYQIIGLHSCQSYAYYVQQAFRAKATDEDPEGEALTDFLATGRSSYASDSPTILRVLLRRLMDGVAAIDEGSPADAPDWLSIVTEMNSQVWGINYGVAGVRHNEWVP